MIDTLALMISDHGSCKTINHNCLIEVYEILKMLPVRFKNYKVSIHASFDSHKLNLDLNKFTLLLQKEATVDYMLINFCVEVTNTLA